VPAPEVVVLGDANPDLVLTGDVVPRFGQAEQVLDGATLTLGGSGAIVAAGLARLGIHVALCGSVGSDPLGELVRSQLTTAGVDIRWLRTDLSMPTGISVVLGSHDRAILTFPGTISALTPDDVDPDLLTGARHVHVASYFLQPALAEGLPALLAAAKAAGATTSLDTNWDPAERWEGVLPLLPHVDVLLPNLAELFALAGTGGDQGDPRAQDAAAGKLSQAGTSVALKAGAAGGVLWTASGERLSSDGLVVDVVDTTGAGDSFDSGYLSALLDGKTPQQCLDRAVICGSLSTRAVGGTTAQPDVTEVESFTLSSR
jgi:ribokinase